MLIVLVSFAESFATLRVGCKPIGDSYLAWVPFGAPSCPPSPGSGSLRGALAPPFPGSGPCPGALLVPVSPLPGFGVGSGIMSNTYF